MWHSGGRLSKEPGEDPEVTGSLQKPLASFQLCKGALNSSANVPLKWLSAFLSEASVCRTAELPPEPPSSGEGAWSRWLPLACSPQQHWEGEVSSCPTQTHAQSPWHAHTDRHPHTEECTQRCIRLIYMDASFLMLLIGWLESKVPALPAAIKARLVVKVVNLKGKGFSDCFHCGSCCCCLTKAFPLFTLCTFGAH